MRIVLATICCTFGSWGLVKKLNFCSNFEHKQDFEVKAQARFEAGVWWVFFCWCFVEIMLNQIWILVHILKLGLVKILKFKFYGEAHVWLRFWSWCLVEILKLTELLMTSDWCLEQTRVDTSEALFAGYNGDENAHVFGPPGHSPSNLHHFPSWYWQRWIFK